MRPLLLLAALFPLAAAAQAVGAEACRACHPRAYDAWKEGPHARALTGVPEARRRDPRCASCHAPDPDRPGEGVGCESCHGGGRLYAQSYVMRDRELARAVGLLDAGEKTCLACHTDASPSLTRFEYAKKLPLIEHGERAERPASPPVR